MEMLRTARPNDRPTEADLGTVASSWGCCDALHNVCSCAQRRFGMCMGFVGVAVPMNHPLRPRNQPATGDDGTHARPWKRGRYALMGTN